ncbi:hypothetical protein [Gallaecimonas sp. GXIMD4217]|uniref:hypothetical protein n=1 Tax=Gallaecimonas sp. GXIMD4217 TaxID=3131927 RepID=UPI00311AFA0B
MTNWLANQAGTKTAAIPTTLCSQLFEAAEHFDNLSAEQLLLQFSDHFAGNAASQEFSSYLEGLDPEIKARLEQEWQQLKDRLGDKLPERLKALCQPLASYQGANALPLLSSQWQGEQPSARFNLTAELATALEVEVFSAEEAASKIGDELPDNKCLLGLGMSGSLAAGLSSELPLSMGSLGIQAGADSRLELDSCYLFAEQAWLGQALAEIGSDWRSPLSLDSTLAAMADGQPRLYHHSLNFEGSINLGASLTLGKSFSRRLNELDQELFDTPISLDAELAASVSLSLKDKGTFQLEVQRDTDSSLFVRLQKCHDQTRGSLLKLGADVRLMGLTDNLRRLVDKGLPDMGDFDARLEEFKWPGKLLEEHLALPEDGTFTPLLQQLLASPAADIQPLAGQLKALIAERLATLVDDRVSIWNRDPALVSEELVALVGQELGLSGAALQSLHQLLDAPLTDALNQLKGALADRVGELHELADDTLDKVLAPLVAVEANINEVKTQIQDGMSGAIAPFERFLGKYGEFRTSILKAIGEHLEQRVGVAWQASREHKESRETTFSCRILRNTPATRTLYRALWCRDLGNLKALLDQARAEGSVDRIKGSYSSLNQDKRQASLTISLLGFEASWSSKHLELAKVVSDHQGNILACRSQAEVDKVQALLGESRKVSMLAGLDLLALLDGQLMPAPLKLQFSVSDDDMTDAEVRQYFAGMEKLGLCQQGASTMVLNAFGANPGKGARKASLATSLNLTAVQWRTFLDGNALGENELAEHLLDTFEQALARADARGAEATAQRPAYQQQKGLDRLAWYQGLAKQKRRNDALEWQFNQPVGNKAVKDQMNRLWILARSAIALAEGYQAMTEHWQELQLLLAAVTPDPEAITATTQAMNRALTDAVDDAMRTGNVVFERDNEIPWPTLGLYLALAELAGRRPPYSLVTELTLNHKGQQQRYLIG